MKNAVITFLYLYFLKPLLFKFDAELVHNIFTSIGSLFSKYKLTRFLLYLLFYKKTAIREKNIKGIKFNNPVGLGGGFDYNGKMVGIFKSIGFGFNTVGTVTYSYYEGNNKPRLVRLPKSKSLLVNKGFKSLGVKKVVNYLNKPYLKDITFGVSVGSSNISKINTIKKAIKDYINTFKILEKSPYIKYYELNISCPNTKMPESFTDPINFNNLISRVEKLKLSRPVFIKMPNELNFLDTEKLVTIALSKGLNAFIFSNLVKSRSNSNLNKEELKKVERLPGNFSGKPCNKNALALVRHFRNKHGNKIVLVGCGGIMCKKDAEEMFSSGADLIQLVTGLIYRGPTLVNDINS